MKKNIIWPVALALLVVLGFGSCSKSGGGGSTGGGTTTPTIKILTSMTFSPGTLTVKQNTLINITNEDATQHSATSDDGTTFNIVVPAASTRTYNCPTVGTFAYHCTFHAGMAGTLTVTP